MNCDIPDWIDAVASACTALLAIYLWRNNKESENNKYWNDNLPVISIGSPCNILQNACEIDISKDFWDENWAILFRLGNFSKTTAWALSLEFYSDEVCASESLRSLYVSEVPVTNLSDKEGGIPIYSKYHVNPKTKEISYNEFKICECLNDCSADKKRSDIKDLFIKCSYSSCLDQKCAKRIESIFQIKLECTCGSVDKEIFIKSIVRKTYTVC